MDDPTDDGPLLNPMICTRHVSSPTPAPTDDTSPLTLGSAAHLDSERVGKHNHDPSTKSPMSEPTASKPWICTALACRRNGEPFEDYKKFRQHERCHVKTHFCGHPTCMGRDIGFSTRRDLARHEATVHDEKVFVCPVCQTQIKRRDNLQRHMKTAHGA
ncbi:hypothetical protein BJ170DRAFT_166795 [Xylariales sp. AK1849]|nr:hypothetical protein BJ170DRAFT_166795 [Xylariales sp. AK1849]